MTRFSDPGFPWQRLLLMILAAWLVFAVAGCVETSQEELVYDFFGEWFGDMHERRQQSRERGVYDEEAEAVAGAWDIIDTAYETDKLMEEGRQKEDPAKMNEAIARRPAAWTYRVSRSALALQLGDVGTCNSSRSSAY